ncbi:MAG: sulfatase-like hydrolase/transferase [Myxococcales bacterium]|nr:sulfatase-like hydrolase/transferase [Myxococcales bacterium]
MTRTPPAAARLPNRLEQHVTAGIAGVCCLCLVELLAPPEAIPLAHLGHVLALSTLAGTGLGLALFVALERIARVPWVGPLVLPIACFGGALGLSQRLSAFARLDSPYRNFAIGVLVANGLGALVLGALAVGVQTRPNGHAGPLMGVLRRRRVTGAGLILAVSALMLADRVLYVGLYPSAHLAMRIVSALLLSLAVRMLWPNLSANLGLQQVRRVAWLSAGCLTVLLTLSSDDDGSLSAFGRNPFAGTLLRHARMAFDWDRDGFSAVLGGGDCDDFNPRVFPTAREIPGNGIDDNCFLGDLDKTDGIAEDPVRPDRPSPLNVVLITVDTLRWDRLGENDPRFGPSGRDTMPNLDRFARSSMNFTRAYAPGSWTSISLGSLMHGRFPRNLTWVAWYETDRFRMLRRPFDGELAKGETFERMFPLAWDSGHRPLSHWLRRRGMKTIAVVDDGFSLMLARDVGASHGFEVYREVNPGVRVSNHRSDRETTDIALENLRWAVTDRPFFLWVHYFGPHAPNTAHPEIGQRGDSFEEGYDHEVRYLDAHLGRLLRALSPHLPSTAVFITSDHGEDFFDTYRSHGMDLREALIRVPLIARVPGWQKGQSDRLVGLVDLMPTILALTNTPPPAGLEGIDLRPHVERGVPWPERHLYLDNWFYRQDGSVQRDTVGSCDGKTKLLLDRRDNSFSKVRQEPMRDVPLASERIAGGPAMRALLRYLERSGGQLNLAN